MRTHRRLAASLIVAALTASLAAGARADETLGRHPVTVNATTRAHATQGPCTGWASRVVPAMGGPKVHRRVLAEIRCSVRWVGGVPGGIAMAFCIARRESGRYTWPWAENPSGSTGVFQWVASTWDGVRARYRWLAVHTMPSRYSMRSNVLFFARVAHDEGLGPWGGGCG